VVTWHHRVLQPEGQLFYVFGVLMMEVVYGKKPGNLDEENDYNNGISYWLWEFHRMGRLLDAADHKLNREFAKDGLECLHLLGVACCHPNPHQRPSMRTVLQVLSGEATPLVPPESPAII